MGTMNKNAKQPKMRIDLTFEQAVQKMVKVADAKVKARSKKK